MGGPKLSRTTTTTMKDTRGVLTCTVVRAKNLEVRLYYSALTAPAVCQLRQQPV